MGIRFGGFNEALYKKKHTMQWIPTIGSDTWKIEIHEVAFHGDDILGKTTTALINPGFPFIALRLMSSPCSRGISKTTMPEQNSSAMETMVTVHLKERNARRYKVIFRRWSSCSALKVINSTILFLLHLTFSLSMT